MSNENTVKIPSVVAAALKSNGTVKGDKLTISLSWLDEHTVQGRSSSDEKQNAIKRLLSDFAVRIDETGALTKPDGTPFTGFGAPEAGETLMLTRPMIAACELPETYITQPAAWSGIGEPSELVFNAAGLVARRAVTYNDDDAMVIRIYLRPATEADKADREKRRADKAARKAAPAAAAAVSSDAGAAESTTEAASAPAE